MKKFLAAALILALMLFLFNSCTDDGDTADGGNGDAQNDGDIQDNTPLEPADDGSVAGFLAYYGLRESDIKPEYFIEFGELKMDSKGKPGSPGSAGFITITVDKSKTGEPEVRAWFEKIYSKMQKLSSDGKLYTNFLTFDTESTLENLFQNPHWEQYPGTMWSYPYKLQSGDAKINVSTSHDYENGIYKMSISVFE